MNWSPDFLSSATISISYHLALKHYQEILLSVVTQLLPYVGYPRALNALRVLNEVVPE